MAIMALTNTAYDAVNDFTLVITTNRTSGVGPLSVSFDLIENSVFSSDDIPMLAEFMWDFGDDGDPYNIGKGYCPAHVYRSIGSYTATVTAYYKNTIKTASVEITVSDFDETWTTYYISADGSDSNDGLSESTAFLTPKYAFDNFTAQNVRFRLRQGDTFSKATDIIWGSQGGPEVTGPVVIDSYEDSNSPSSVKPIILDTRTGSTSVAILSMLNVYDFRFINLKLQATGGGVDTRDSAGYPQGISQSSVTPSAQCLILDCDVQGTSSTAIHIEGDFHVVQDTTVRDGGSYGVYEGWGSNCGFIGMSMQEFANDSPEYTMRLSSGIEKNYVAYCDLRGDYTKTTFQIRGDNSSWNYVWNNQMDRFAGINQTNNEEDETLHHNTFDSNIVVARDYSATLPSYAYQTMGFLFSSNYSMARNNIIYGFASGFGLNHHTIVGGVKKTWYHNNTVIALNVNSCFLSTYKSAENTELRNNIFYNSALTSSFSDRFINVNAPSVNLAWPTDLSQINSDFNCMIGAAWGLPASQTFIGVAYYNDDPTFDEWQSLWNGDVNSYYEDPVLNTTIDMDLVTDSLDSGFAVVQAGSSALDSGERFAITTHFDFEGNLRTNKTMGAR